jgi:mono/diheme cytochrome c family protein
MSTNVATLPRPPGLALPVRAMEMELPMKYKFHVLFPLIGLQACIGACNHPSSPPDLSEYDVVRGGRYYDKWFADQPYADAFDPDASDTPGAADGAGGPFGDGTLPGPDGRPMLNEGHDYRLKNFFGWDLRGKAGLYGPDHAAKPYVLPIDLLDDTRSVDELAAWFSDGGQGLPGFGEVLTPEEIDDLAAFVVAMRTGDLARADQVWTLSKAAENHYELLDGGDAERGRQTIAATCAACHGADGTAMLIDDGEFTLGSFGRQMAYEGWMKVLVGHPGSVMGPQVDVEASDEQQAQQILDVFAALCDRQAFPVTGELEDVADGDLRCGSYLR